MLPLPPFASLRAFESAARHLNFARAAEELSVTASAISHQIKQLETYLDVQLFRRVGRGIVLTGHGQEYLPDIRDALNCIGLATSRLRNTSGNRRLTIFVLGLFAARWLTPRISSFQDLHPEIEVRLVTSTTPVDFRCVEADMAISFGRGDWSGTHCDLIMEETFFPVCSPQLIADHGPIERPKDLTCCKLIHNIQHPNEWQLWYEAAGVHDIETESYLELDTLALALQAAVEGLGVAIGRQPLVAEDLEYGRLVAPLDIEASTGDAYYLVYPLGRAKKPTLVAFRQWMLREASKTKTKKELQGIV